MNKSGHKNKKNSLQLESFLPESLRQEKYRQLFKFVLVGVANTAVDYLTFFVFSGILHLYYLFSQILAYIAGTLNSFFLNKNWTFQNQERGKQAGKQFAGFLVVNTFSLLVTMIGLKILVEGLHLNPYLSKVPITVLSLAVNFAGNKLWVFKK